ncbi:MAG TPA: hypothetical protein VFD11_03465, partial [Thiopseudomonas sp.]|nr:hypothetical protein [Thiopseudomonas sp.]
MARPRTITDQQRAQVLELKRKHSYNEVAAITGLPLGTVRTIVRRSGTLSDNPKHRLMFTLPAIKHSASTQLAAFVMPSQRTVTGDLEIDAVLWLREVIATGDPLAIDRALQAVGNIKTPLAEIETRYASHLRKNGGSMFAAFGAMGFADIEDHVKRSKATALLRHEAAARFGNDPDLMTEAERWVIRVLDGVDVGLMDSDRSGIADRFKQHPELMPHTLADCLHELSFWDELYWLKQAVDADEPAQECYERGYFVFELMAQIRP